MKSNIHRVLSKKVIQQKGSRPIRLKIFFTALRGHINNFQGTEF
jgi:hypothetical protein